MSNMFAPITTAPWCTVTRRQSLEDYTEITDTDRETITHIDTLHKTYSVVTFRKCGRRSRICRSKWSEPRRR